jgi:hypothetical protein
MAMRFDSAYYNIVLSSSSRFGVRQTFLFQFCDVGVLVGDMWQCVSVRLTITFFWPFKVGSGCAEPS